MRKIHSIRSNWAIPLVLAFVLLVGLACELSGGAGTSPTLPEGAEQKLFQGITYKREVRTSPRPMVIHIVEVDLKAGGIRPLVTPPDASDDKPLAARTVSEFVADYGVQLAINGDGFTPWYAVGPVYFPHSGDMVEPLGFAASNGEVYSEDTLKHPILHITRNNRATINDAPGNEYNAISGLDMLVQSGAVLAQKNNAAHPRTAVGVNMAGSKLIIVVVDGRQPGYSEGATLTELANIMLENGARDAMNLDGGGSSTLVMADGDGNPVVLNSPIHLGVPGTERPVANHLGIFAREK